MWGWDQRQGHKGLAAILLAATFLVGSAGIASAQDAAGEVRLRKIEAEVRALQRKVFPGGGSARDEEMSRLKRELSKVTKERDFLKDAAAYFAKQSPNGTR